MKIKGTFVVRDIAGDTVIVPVGETALSYNGMITTTPTGAAIWKALETDCDKESIVQMLLERFDVDYNTASADTEEFLDNLRSLGVLEEE